MVIEEVHGLHATSMSLSDRFTMLSAAAPQRFVPRPRRRPSVNSYFNQNTNNNNSNFAQQMARRLEMEVKRQAMKQRLGALRRFGSESSLPGMRRSNSWGNLSQASVKQRVQWRQSNGNLSRAVSFENVSQAWRNFRRRGGGARALRGRFRGRGRGARGMRGVRGRRGGAGARGGQRVQRTPQQAPRGRPVRGLRARGRGRGRGGILRNQPPKPVPTKEELDDQLDRYMAGTKTALDKEIDEYMKNAMEFE